MPIEQGSARLHANPNFVVDSDKELENNLKRVRAMRRASARLANLHPQEWKVLLAHALKEEGLTN